MSKYQNNKMHLLKEKCLTYLGGKRCSECKTDFLPICCYDFHHKQGNKDFDISQYKKFDETLKKELNKCVIVCAICHRLIENGLPTFSWWNI